MGSPCGKSKVERLTQSTQAWNTEKVLIVLQDRSIVVAEIQDPMHGHQMTIDTTTILRPRSPMWIVLLANGRKAVDP